MKRTLLIILTFILMGCFPSVEKIQYKTHTNYTLNQKMTIPFGGVMIIKKDERYVTYSGMPNQSYMDNAEEIIYTAKEGDAIRLMYREFYRNGYPVNFSQELIYDLSKSDKIVFRNYHIKIFEANNLEISFMVIKE